jgi:hypothetical protein
VACAGLSGHGANGYLFSDWEFDMIDFDKPVQTRDGRRVTILTVEARDKDYPILGYVGEDTDLACWSTEGNRSWGSGCFSLINAPEKFVGYINVYENISFNGCHESAVDASRGAGTDRIACVRFEYTKGQFDE